MSNGGYKIQNEEAVHSITFAGVKWVDEFTKKAYHDIPIDRLRHCLPQKDLVLPAWCIMSNCLHLLVSARENNLSAILRDFKKIKSKQLISATQNKEHESRKDWMMKIFKKKRRLIQGTKLTNSGGRTSNGKNVAVPLLPCQS